MSRLTPPRTSRLPDPAVEEVRRNHEERIKELQALPAAGMRVIKDVSLADGVITPIAHGLGRAPAIVLLSPPRDPASTGRIEEVRSGSYSRATIIALEANGWGATITVDVAVF